MSKRFDQRSKDTFKKDIKFGTQMETYFFKRWETECFNRDDISVIDWDHNGVCNNGTFIAKGDTSGADYIVDMEYKGTHFEDEPLEVKWVPTPGKFTLKVGDLKAYIREKASILFIYNTNPSVNLRKPKTYDYEKHIALIEKNSEHLRWGIMFSDEVKLFLHENKDNIKKIPYMGFKPGIVLLEKDFPYWFEENRFEQN